ncbi:MAG: endonuclease MutS2 [Bacteroidota bacterium]
MIYPSNFEVKTGFDRIRELVKGHCLFEPGKERVDGMAMMKDPGALNEELDRTAELLKLMEEGGELPVSFMPDIREALKKAAIEGAFLEEEEVNAIGKSLDTVRAIVQFFRSDEKVRYPQLTRLCEPVKIYPYVTERIKKILNKHGRIRDNASAELQKIRGAIAEKQSAISKRISQLMKKAQAEGWVEEDAGVTFRNGRPVIPIAASHKRKISGLVHDESATGRTAFIEPAEVVELGNELRELEYAERREIIQILLQFTADIRPYLPDLETAQHFLAMIDFTRAKALFARRIGAIRPQVDAGPGFDWVQAVHPLLLLAHRVENKEVVPLNLFLSGKNRILVISGPNAGGKSVCLKTVGLLQYMLQCGLLVPVSEQSKFGLFGGIFIDIGDEQSIDNDLSTYSSHLLNMKHFVKNASPDTLVLIDEFGTGTEPMIGGAIAEAILEELNEAGTYGVLTTHYTNLKHFATSAEGIINGAMLFDNQRMQPLFQLQIGKPGSSFAFEIARKIGLPESVLQKASEKVGQEHIDFDKHLRDILRDKKYWESKRDKIRSSEKKLEELMARYEKELAESDRQRKEIIRTAKQQAETLLNSANRQIEQTIREIKEAHAEKERTREVRKELEEFTETVREAEKKEEERITVKMEEIKQRGDELARRRPDLARQARQKSVPRQANQDDGVIRVGDLVRIKGQNIPGEVIELKGKNCTVAFGMVKTVTKTEQLEKMSGDESGRHILKKQSGIVLGEWDIGKRRLSFRPEIDLRGKRAEEALRMVAEFIDEAIMVSSRELHILHGKGDGILRQMIREYLRTVDVVESFGDEHVERGGAGITVVRLDI